MRAHRIAAAAAGGAASLMIAAPVASWATSAPAGSATGTVLRLGSAAAPIAAASSTAAQDGPTSSTSKADVLELGGHTVIGGSSSGGKPSSGSVADTGSAGPIRAQAATWSATSSAPSRGSSSSEGKTSAAELSSSVINIGAARSDSKASYTTNPDGSTRSCGSTSTDGLSAQGSGLNIDLLHSDASCTGSGSAYLANINGTQVGTQAQIQAACKTLNVPSLLALNCVTATGGAGNLLEAVLTGNVGPAGSGIPFDAFASAGTGGTGGPTPVAPLTGTGGPVTTASAGAPASVVSAPAGPGTAANSGGSLPFTGAPIALWIFGSIALLGLGAVTVRASSLVAPQLFG